MDNVKQTKLVFGLDIGTRTVVGTVGYKDGKDFYAVAQCVREHETRAMLDGQIHDIGRVGATIAEVKKELEKQIEQPLTEVCIAAAGRVLETVTTSAEYEFAEETVVNREHMHTLDLLGVEKAQELLKEKSTAKYKFYCVGYSIVRYYLNGELFTSLEGHKAVHIAEDIIVTFLPEDVVDGLYAAVGLAGLEVANLTLEPIAAINVAIPETFRMLNIALVDVGAGTSDICITKDGSVIAYGMIPYAGDELTELIVQRYLVDFNMAEQMKLMSGESEEVVFYDIMGIEHKIASTELWELLEPVVDKITSEVSDKIKELNGGKSVSATFVVGGGGKIHGFTDMLADKLGLLHERVALRGEEVMKNIHFAQEEVKKDPLLVTPIGICLNYYEQKNNFILVHFNEERIKLYDNNHLTIVDAALQAGFPNEQLFPRRGQALQFTVNGKQRIVRGEAGESAVLELNGSPASINTPLEPNCYITISPSTEGKAAECTIGQLEEYTESTIVFYINGRQITCPKFVEVNGALKPPTYPIANGDVIETRNYYTIEQLAEFMDVKPDLEKGILVNNRPADTQAFVYENFEVEWTPEEFKEPEEHTDAEPEQPATEASQTDADSRQTEASQTETDNRQTEVPQPETDNRQTEAPQPGEQMQSQKPQPAQETPQTREVLVFVNGQPVRLSKKAGYVFVDVFDYIDFDLSRSNGRAIVTKVNGADAQYTQTLYDGDKIEIYWKETGL